MRDISKTVPLRKPPRSFHFAFVGHGRQRAARSPIHNFFHRGETMRNFIKPPMFALALAMATFFSNSLTSVASAGEKDRPIIRKGVYDGIWHTDPVTIIVEKVE